MRCDLLSHVVNTQARHCSCVQVLRNLPFLHGLPDAVFEALLSSGNLVRYGKGDSIWSPLRPAHVTARGGHLKAEGGMVCEGNGSYVVRAGLVKRSYTTPEGRTVVISPDPVPPELFPTNVHHCLGCCD